MTCAELENTLCEYVDGTLDAERKAAAEQHLAACATCAELVRDVSAAVSFMEQVPPVEPPGELVTRLLFQVPAGRRAGRRRAGMMAGLRSWFQPILQPRFAMGMAMTILSFSLLGRFAGIPERTLRPSDLHPAKVWSAVEDRLQRLWDSGVKYYESLRVVYEIQNRLSEWSEEDRLSGQPGSRDEGGEGSGSRPSGGGVETKEK